MDGSSHFRVYRLTQAILAKAFRGEIVSTEAEQARRKGWDYEPTGKFLETLSKGPAKIRELS